MARNYKGEAEWAASKYVQIKFSVGREEARKFRQVLDRANVSAVEWFRMSIARDLTQPSAPKAPKAPKAAKQRKRLPSPSPETVAEWARLHEAGLSIKKIAAASIGYDFSTVSKRLKRLAESGSDGQSEP